MVHQLPGAPQVLHGRRQFVVVSRPVESTQRTQPYHHSTQYVDACIHNTSMVVAPL